MAEERKKKDKQEIDANDVIRDYVESDDRLPQSDAEAAQQEVPWQDQALQDTKEPAEAVLTGGDVDAAWDQAAVGDETVGGSSPTPDQDIVDEIGEALGVTYQEGEPLRTSEKIEQRDAERWELHPASSEDFAERTREIDQRPAPKQSKPRSKGAKKKAA
jgi:hypothetical protein